MRSCPQQVVLPSLHLSMDGSSEESKVAHVEYPFCSCGNSRCQKNVGRNEEIVDNNSSLGALDVPKNPWKDNGDNLEGGILQRVTQYYR